MVWIPWNSNNPLEIGGNTELIKTLKGKKIHLSDLGQEKAGAALQNESRADAVRGAHLASPGRQIHMELLKVFFSA